MKGRRKVKTAKWDLQAQLIRESRSIFASEKHAQRWENLLSKAEAASSFFEPVGMLVEVSMLRDKKLEQRNNCEQTPA
jgi:hypothetical protein